MFDFSMYGTHPKDPNQTREVPSTFRGWWWACCSSATNSQQTQWQKNLFWVLIKVKQQSKSRQQSILKTDSDDCRLFKRSNEIVLVTWNKVLCSIWKELKSCSFSVDSPEQLQDFLQICGSFQCVCVYNACCPSGSHTRDISLWWCMPWDTSWHLLH